jgi:glycerophosphoryl diester phosphodiesterase
MRHRVQVVCHKGANHHAPENTWAAARLCVEWGVDTVEIDVSTSQDGVFYLFHGPNLQRTTNGTGWVGSYSAQELDQLDAGSWFSPEFAGERMPRLEPFLRWIKGKAKVFLDVKNADAGRLASLIREIGLQADCFFWSFNPDWMQELHAIDPALALKVNVKSVQDIESAQQALDARIVEMDPKNITPEILDTCHRLGIQVMALYLGNDPGVLRQILTSGVDLINTDYGDEVLAVLRDIEEK